VSKREKGNSYLFIHHHVFNGCIDAFFYLCFYKLTPFFSLDILVLSGKLTTTMGSGLDYFDSFSNS